LCLLIGGAAIGFVWQKSEINRLGQQRRQREARLAQLQTDNKRLGDQVAILHSPPLLDQRARELQLGLQPAKPTQMAWLIELPEMPSAQATSRQLARRQAGNWTQ